jgi:hypothetical protein
MYAFQLERVTHFSLTRQNASLCGVKVRDGIELDRRQGLICLVCAKLEHETWVDEWHRKYGVLGSIMPRALNMTGNDQFDAGRLVA